MKVGIVGACAGLVLGVGVVWGVLGRVEKEEILKFAARSDFRGYYLGGMMVEGGVREKFYELQTQISWQAKFLPGVDSEINLTPYINPPWLAWVWRPLVLWDFVEAYVIGVGVNAVVAGAWVVWCLREMKTVEEERKFFWVLAFVGYFPFWEYLLQTQMSLWLGCVYLAGKKLAEKRLNLWAGMILALLWAKPQFGLLAALFLAVKKNWAAVLGMAVGVLVAAAMSVAMVGFGGMFRYLELLKSAGEWDMKLGMRQEVEVAWRGFLGSGWKWVVAEVAGLVVLVEIWRRTRNEDLAWTSLIVGTLLLAVHVNAYDLAILSLPAVWWMRNRWGGKFLVLAYIFTGLTTILVDYFGMAQIGPVALFGILIYILGNVRRLEKPVRGGLGWGYLTQESLGK